MEKIQVARAGLTMGTQSATDRTRRRAGGASVAFSDLGGRHSLRKSSRSGLPLSFAYCWKLTLALLGTCWKAESKGQVSAAVGPSSLLRQVSTLLRGDRSSMGTLSCCARAVGSLDAEHLRLGLRWSIQSCFLPWVRKAPVDTRRLSGRRTVTFLLKPPFAVWKPCFNYTQA